MPTKLRSGFTTFRVALLLTVMAVGSLIYTATSGLAFAGPPLICHPFAIPNDAASLPWGNSGFAKNTKFNVKTQLVSSTLALLTDDTPILIRMETMRRAALYGDQNPTRAFELLAALEGRVLTATLENESKPLAWFDAGYFAQSLQQVGVMGRGQTQAGQASALTGYDWALKALELDPQNYELAFGVALTLNASHEYTAAAGYQEKQDACVRTALQGTETNKLLKKNIENHFNTSIAVLNKKLAVDR